MVAILYFRLYCKNEEDLEKDKVAESSRESPMEDANEKRAVAKSSRRSCCWPFAWLTAVRACELLYFAFLHASIFVFDQSGYFRGVAVWHYNSEDEDHSKSSMRWARALSLITLVYHLATFVLLIVLRKKEARKWRVFGISTMFGDVLAMWSLIHALRILYPSYNNYCYDVPRKFDYERHGVLSYLGKGQFNQERYFTCGLLDAIYAIAAIPALSHFISIIATALDIKRRTKEAEESEVFPKIGDLEQGTVPRPSGQFSGPSRHASAASSRASTPPPPSPPPSYRSRSGSNQTQSRPPSYREIPGPRPRTSVETTSTIDPDLYLVSDGWRAPEQPPNYSSRPPSLRS